LGGRVVEAFEPRPVAGGGAWPSDVTPGVAAAPRVSDEPHSPQNLSPAGFGVPQTEHTTANAVPHSRQNFLPGRFSVPQFEQIICVARLEVTEEECRVGYSPGTHNGDC
jgi:hypothetical protein